MSSSARCEACFTVAAELGLHARPAGEFVALAGRFEAAIEVGSGEEWVDGRSILSLLSLGARQGTVLRIRAAGADASAALHALGGLLERHASPDSVKS